MTSNQKNIRLKKWGVAIELVVQSQSSADAIRHASALLMPLIIKAARDARVNLVIPYPGDLYLSGGVRGKLPPGTASRTAGVQVIFNEHDIPLERGWREASDWLFQALEDFSSETIKVVSLTEFRVGA